MQHFVKRRTGHLVISSLGPVPFIIIKRPSAGRGEYELSGSQGQVSAVDLADHEFTWLTPYGDRPSEVVLRIQGGKARFRMADGNRGTHIHSQAAALTMLPPPIRDEDLLAHDGPVLLQNRYVLDIAVRLDRVEGGVATVRPWVVIARSGSPDDDAHQVRFSAPGRLERIMRVQARAADLPAPVAAAVEEHRSRLDNEPTVGAGAVRAVAQIIASLAAVDAALYVPGSDPLPALETLLGLQADVAYPAPEEPPTAVNPEIRRRLESEYRAVKSRGRSGRLFKEAVQDAYGHTCVFCGFRALDIPGLARSGVDAAHILPWGQFDLDVVTNGLQLCKLDHWAFDAHVLLLRHEGGVYRVDLNPEFEPLINDADTRAFLERSVGMTRTSAFRSRTFVPTPSTSSGCTKG